MVKYYRQKQCGYYLYVTSKCTIEPMHVHASNDDKLSERGSAKFWVRADGSVKLADKGRLSERDIKRIEKFIKENYEEMHETWEAISTMGYYNKD